MSASRLAVLLLLVPLTAGCERAERVSYGVEEGQWRSYGADPANTKYSPLDQIDAGNFGDLEVVWTADSPDVAWRAVSPANRFLFCSQIAAICAPSKRW